MMTRRWKRIAMFGAEIRDEGVIIKYGKLAKKIDFDDDLFSFLDNISKKVHHDRLNQIEN